MSLSTIGAIGSKILPEAVQVAGLIPRQPLPALANAASRLPVSKVAGVGEILPNVFG